MNIEQFMEYLHQNFTLDRATSELIRNILDYARTFVAEDQQYEFLCKTLDGTIGLSDREIRMISL